MLVLWGTSWGWLLYCIQGHTEFCVLNGFREVAVNVLCWLSMSISLLFLLLWAECECMSFCQGVWSPCLLCLLQVSMYLFGTPHHCVSSFLQSLCLLSSLQCACRYQFTLDALSSSARFWKDRSVPFPTQQLHLPVWHSLRFLTRGFYMVISFHSVSSCSVVSTLWFCGRLPQLICGHLCSESCSSTGGSWGTGSTN